MSTAEDLARCDREIERICEEALNGNRDIHGMLQGLHDWRTEKKLILGTRTSLLNGTDKPKFNIKENPNG
jgi:hypothetical protein